MSSFSLIIPAVMLVSITKQRFKALQSLYQSFEKSFEVDKLTPIVGRLSHPRGKLINILLYFIVNKKTNTIGIISFANCVVGICERIVKLN